MSSVSSVLITLDKTFESVPVVSSVTNLVDLVQKSLFVPSESRESEGTNHYYKYLNGKSTWRCVVLLIPIFGNIAIKIYDYKTRYSREDYVLKMVRKDGRLLKHASPELKKNRNVVKAAIKQNPWSILDADKSFLDDKEMVLVAVGIYGRVLEKISERLKQDRDIVIKAIEALGLALEYAPSFWSDREMIMLAIEGPSGLGHVLKFVSPEDRDEEMILKAVARSPYALNYLELKERVDPKVMRAVLPTLFKSAYPFCGKKLILPELPSTQAPAKASTSDNTSSTSGKASSSGNEIDEDFEHISGRIGPSLESINPK